MAEVSGIGHPQGSRDRHRSGERPQRGEALGLLSGIAIAWRSRRHHARCRSGPRHGPRAAAPGLRAGRPRHAGRAVGHRGDDGRARGAPPPPAPPPGQAITAMHTDTAMALREQDDRRRRPYRRAGRQAHHRRRVGQGRRRQVDDRGQPGARPGRQRPRGRPARRRHLRPVDAAHARRHREARIGRRQDAEADRALSGSDHVDRLHRERGHADDLARPDGVERARADAARRAAGATSTCWSSTCRRAPATPSSPSPSAWRWPAP